MLRTVVFVNYLFPRDHLLRMEELTVASRSNLNFLKDILIRAKSVQV